MNSDLSRSLHIRIIGYDGEPYAAEDLMVETGMIMLPAEADAVATVARYFRALGDPTRLRLLEFLVDGEHTIAECVDYVGLSQGRVSMHLGYLSACGYVAVRRAGRCAFYRLADARVAHLVSAVHVLAAENCAAACACNRVPLRQDG